MKTTKNLFFVTVLVLAGCAKSGKETISEPVANETNQTLYDQVMDVHDEVMPKMNDIYEMKKKLKDSLSNQTDLSEEKKQEIELTIQQLDSAHNAMMIWMHQFNPPADSPDTEAYREYMEMQLEKVKKMREEVLEALEKGKNQ